MFTATSNRMYPTTRAVHRLLERWAAGSLGNVETFTVASALTRLSPRERQVIEAYYLNPAPSNLVARRVGLTRNSMNVTLSNARQRLASQLQLLLET
jgi:DNA-directed RNA polymerase specialized sigma24 family protein